MIESLFDIKYLMTDVFLGTYFGCFMRVFPTSSPTSQGTFQNAKHRWGWGLTNGRVVGRSHGPVNLKPRQGIVRSSNINPTKKNKTSLHIPQKIDIFCWVEIYSSCFYVHHQFLGGLPTKTNLKPPDKKLRFRVTGIWRKFMAPVPLPVPSFKPPLSTMVERKGSGRWWFLVPGTCWETTSEFLRDWWDFSFRLLLLKGKNYLWFWWVSRM